MSFSLDKRVELELRGLPGNNICADCDGKNPQWASVSFGIFMCLECSGRHRALGVHISFVRSVTMDSWNDKQIQKMRVGGNDKLNQFLQQYGIGKTTPIPQKYNAPAAALYRDRIDAQVHGRPLPTELPASPNGGLGSVGSTHSSAGSLSSSGVAQGTDPLPGETEAQYVARQRILQEEARERMRQKFGASNGLRSGSGGGMAGIGSDPNYRPGQPARSSGTPDISELGANAFSFVSSWADTISKTTQQLVQEATSNQGSSSASSSTHGGGGGQSQSQSQGQGQAADPWAAIATGAVGFWKQATEVTTDLVNIITKPEDDEGDLKFPRPQGWEDKGSSAAGSGRNSAASSCSGSGTVSQSSSSGRLYQQDRGGSYAGASASAGAGAGRGVGVAERERGDKHSVGSSESWDDLQDLDDSTAQMHLQGSGSGGGGRGGAGAGDRSPGIAIAYSGASGSSGGSKGSLSLHPPASASSSSSSGAMAMRRSTSNPSPSTAASQPAQSGANSNNSRTAAAATPTGDDFFATFGI